MPEAPEIRIMSDFINQNSKNNKFKKLFHVEKGNNAVDSNYDEYVVSADFYGKQLQLKFFNRLNQSMDISVFMGMSGNWKLVPTQSWSDTKFTRMRLDRDDGMSLLLYGGYMGPKYKIGGFNTNLPGVKGTLRIGGEGKELFYKIIALGHTIYYDPSICVHHVVEVKKLTSEYMYRVASGIGRGEKKRTLSISTNVYLMKILEYIFKLGAAIVLGIKYILQGTPAKARPVIQFRIDALKGLLGK
jgi:hypothetical protein